MRIAAHELFTAVKHTYSQGRPIEKQKMIDQKVKRGDAKDPLRRRVLPDFLQSSFRAFYNQSMPAGKYSLVPKQARSRESSERVLDAATSILAKYGYYGFSVVDVGRRSKISIGSIYGRFSSKDGLVRSIQERVLDKAGLDEDLFVAAVEAQRPKLDLLLRLLVEHLAVFLEDHATLLHAFIARASQDSVIRARGKRSHDYAVEGFCRLLLSCREEIEHPVPERAVLACCKMMWRSFSSYHGLETEVPQSKGDWNELIEDVYQMAFCYLTAPVRPATPPLLSRKIAPSFSAVRKTTAAKANHPIKSRKKMQRRA